MQYFSLRSVKKSYEKGKDMILTSFSSIQFSLSNGLFFLLEDLIVAYELLLWKGYVFLRISNSKPFSQEKMPKTERKSKKEVRWEWCSNIRNTLHLKGLLVELLVSICCFPFLFSFLVPSRHVSMTQECSVSCLKLTPSLPTVQECLPETAVVFDRVYWMLLTPQAWNHEPLLTLSTKQEDIRLRNTWKEVS